MKKKSTTEESTTFTKQNTKIKVLEKENIKLTKENKILLKQKVKLQEDLLKELISIRVMTNYHLEKVEEHTGEVLGEDREYCQQLGARMITHFINNL